MTAELFPAIYSTLNSQAIVERILPCYNLDRVEDCRFWNRGLSDVYLVRTPAQPYILRVSHHHWRSKSDIDFELELLDFLKNRHLPIAYPLPTQDGKLSIEINAPEGKRYAALFIYAPGEIPVGDLNLKQSWTLGATLAKVHRVGVDFHSSAQRQSLTLKHLLDDSIETIAPFLKHRSPDLEYLHETIAQVKAQLQDFPSEPPFWSICWGDPHSGNAHFTSEEEVMLFDFDQCGYGWRAFDLAKFLHFSLRTGISKKVREEFLAGYQSVQELSEIEMNALQALTQAAHIWVWSINTNAAIVHNWCRLDDSFLKLRIEQLKRLRSPDWQLF